MKKSRFANGPIAEALKRVGAGARSEIQMAIDAGLSCKTLAQRWDGDNSTASWGVLRAPSPQDYRSRSAELLCQNRDQARCNAPNIDFWTHKLVAELLNL